MSLLLYSGPGEVFKASSFSSFQKRPGAVLPLHLSFSLTLLSAPSQPEISSGVTVLLTGIFHLCQEHSKDSILPAKEIPRNIVIFRENNLLWAPTSTEGHSMQSLMYIIDNQGCWSSNFLKIHHQFQCILKLLEIKFLGMAYTLLKLPGTNTSKKPRTINIIEWYI